MVRGWIDPESAFIIYVLIVKARKVWFLKLVTCESSSSDILHGEKITSMESCFQSIKQIRFVFCLFKSIPASWKHDMETQSGHRILDYSTKGVLPLSKIHIPALKKKSVFSSYLKSRSWKIIGKSNYTHCRRIENFRVIHLLGDMVN